MRLLVLTPSLGQVTLGYRDCFAKVAIECSIRGIGFEIADAIAPGMTHHGRNCLLGSAYSWPPPPYTRTPEDFVFWWDSDIAFEPHALFDLLAQFPADVSMVARTYPMRTRSVSGLVESLADATDDERRLPTLEAIRASLTLWAGQVRYEDGRPVWHPGPVRLVELTHCGFGWVLFRADGLRDFCDSGILDREQAPEVDWARRRVIRGFDLGRNPDGTTEGEDVSFCRRWRATGGRIWCAPEATIANGEYSGRFSDYLKAHNLEK